jgi:DNA-binding NarL/FixJ family response regulator
MRERSEALMKSAVKRPIRIALVENDPLRFVGFRAFFDGDTGFDVQGCTSTSVFNQHNYDLILIGSRSGPAIYEVMAALKALDPSVRILATGNSPDEEMALRALCAGAKGYIEESASAAEFKKAVREVHSGSVWASGHLIGKFIERVTTTPRSTAREEPLVFTEREREVLHLLVSGRSNREIGDALGIEERTVKAHVAKLMRKAGVTNRIALSVHALTYSLLGVGQSE